MKIILVRDRDEVLADNVPAAFMGMSIWDSRLIKEQI